MMKKTYVKPEMFYEEYELSTAIAGNCGHPLLLDSVNANSPYTCTYNDGHELWFFNDNCEEMDDMDLFCYQSYDAEHTVFNS